MNGPLIRSLWGLAMYQTVKMGALVRTTVSLLACSLFLYGCSSPTPDLGSSLGLGGNSPEKSSAPAPNLDSTVRAAAANAEATYRYADAAKYYANLLQKYPDDQDLIMAVARNMRYAGQPQQAAELLNTRIAKVGAQEALLLELGKDYLAADQLNLAVPCLKQAREMDPNNWQILSALGVAFDYQGDYASAAQAYEDGLKLAPNNPTLLNNYALSLAQAGQLDKAIETLQTAINQPSAMAETRQNLALLLVMKGDGTGAERLIRSDLPDAMAQNNIDYYHIMGAQ